jgi:hypothetical protein
MLNYFLALDPNIYVGIMLSMIISLFVLKSLRSYVSHQLFVQLDLLFGVCSMLAALLYLLAKQTSYLEIVIRFGLAITVMALLKYYLQPKLKL